MKTKVIVYRFKCYYNDNKIFVIKHYPCGHYYMNQEVYGSLFNKRFVRVSKRYLNNVLELEIPPFDPPYTITD